MTLICPYCDRDMDSELWNAPRKPEPEDYLLCFGCNEVSQFNKCMTLDKIDENELPDEIREEIDLFRHFKKNAKTICLPSSNLH